jgi:hypothetical protein
METVGTNTCTIDFPDLSTADANKMVQSLEKFLRAETEEEITFRREKPDSATQDFGTTLVLIFGTPVAIALAQGIRDFVAKYGDHIRITKDGEVVAHGAAAKNLDATKLTAARGKTTS